KPRAEDEESEDRSPRRRSDYLGERDEETEEIIAHGKRLARSAGLLMFAACLFTTLNILVNAAISAVVQAEVGEEGTVTVLMFVFLMFVFGPILYVIGLGASALLNLGSRSHIVAAVVMNFLLLLMLAGGLAYSVFTLTEDINPILVLPTLVLNPISCVLNLGA